MSQLIMKNEVEPPPLHENDRMQRSELNPLSPEFTPGVEWRGEGKNTTTEVFVEGEGEKNNLERTMEALNISLRDVFGGGSYEPGNVEFNREDIKKVLKSMKKDSSPGPSSENKALYEFLFNLMPNIFTEAFKVLSKIDNFYDSPFKYLMGRDIVFIPKVKVARPSPADYRPISLLEIAYKILAKLYAYQLKPFIPAIVGVSQFGFVPERQMSILSHTIVKLIDEINRQDARGQICLLDIKSAFDTANPDSINFIMEYLFPNSDLPNKIHALTGRGHATLSINGNRGEEIELSVGCGQGCPLSAFRYATLHAYFIGALNILMKKREEGVLEPPIMTINDHRGNNFSVDSQCFADDTVVCTNFKNDSQIKYFLWALDNLSLGTGLEINPVKTKILLFGEHTPEIRTQISQIGKITDRAKHLGITITPDYNLTRDYTYADILDRVKNASEHYVSRCGGGDIINKKAITVSIVSSVAQFAFRALPPKDEMIDKIWKTIIKSLWHYTYEGKTVGRHKVATNRVNIPMENGGLGIATTKAVNLRASLGALTTNLGYCHENGNCLLNRITGLSGKIQGFQYGSRAIDSLKKTYRDAMPMGSSTMEDIKNIMIHLEDDPKQILRYPLVGGKHASFFNPMTARDLTEFRPWTIGSVLDLEVRGRYYRVHEYKYDEDVIGGLPTRVQEKIKELVEVMRSKCKQMPKIKKLTQARFEPLIWMNKADKRFITRYHKRMEKQKYLNEEPPSFFTRVKDGEEVPKNVRVFRSAFAKLKNTKLLCGLKSFQYELLWRTLASKNKLFNMKKVNNNECTKCRVKATSGHQAADCIIPVFFRHILQKSKAFKKRMDPKKLNSLMWEFSLPVKEMSPPLYSQLQTMFIAIKKLSFASWDNETFHRWNPIVMYAKIITCLKFWTLANKNARLPFDWMNEILDEMIDEGPNIYEHYRIQFDHLPA